MIIYYICEIFNRSNMPYDSKTNILYNDFESVEFPIKISQNVINYIYPCYRLITNRTFVSMEQFKNILAGKDRTQTGCEVLSRLFYKGNPWMVCNHFPPPEFDIIKDEIIASEPPKLITEHFNYRDIHKGECIYKDKIFDFEYEVIRKNEGYKDNEKDCFCDFENYELGKSKIKQKGHTFIVEDHYMFNACKIYTKKEREKEEEERINNLRKEEEERWIKFRQEHQEDLKEWLIPIINNQVNHPICSSKRSSIENGYVSYGMVKRIDRGLCDYCTGRCIFKEPILENGKHSEEWYKLGIDKLNIMYL